MSNIGSFKSALSALVGAMSGAAPKLILDEAEELASAMRQKAAQHRKTGNTVDSIQVLRTGDPNRVSIVAGGDLTTKEVRAGSGKSYDYVRAEEFGTQESAAVPFFYSTYRARKAGIKQRVSTGLRKALD